MRIILANTDDFAELTQIWEASVRATHTFLSENNINELRSLIQNTYLFHVLVYKAINEQGDIIGFMGLDKHRLEMLFITPAWRGQGVGKQLLQFAIMECGVTELDVNEQNPQAVHFYQHLGFVSYARSELDGQGNPFPLLHMRLRQVL